MAILTVDSLIGCSSIPSFFGGNSDTPANPTYTVFYQTAAPTSWVKDTTASLNDKALRIIGGANGTALSPGGSLAFTSVFTTKTYPGLTLGSISASATIQPTTVPYVGNSGSNPQFITFSTHSGTLATMASHDHGYQTSPLAPNPSTATGALSSLASAPQTSNTTITFYGPSGTTHDHTLSYPHTHTLTSVAHNHTINSPPHSHPTSTASANFSINYIDVIIAYKA